MIEMKKLTGMLAAETAADKWWDGLSDKEKKAYLQAHPNSKHGGNGGINGVTSDHMLNESKMKML